jgi:cation transport ATPase
MTAADFSIAAFVDINSLTAVTADALLLSDVASPSTSDVPKGLLKVPYLFELSRKIYNKIWQNLLWAVVYNSLAVAVGTGMFDNFGITLSP